MLRWVRSTSEEKKYIAEATEDFKRSLEREGHDYEKWTKEKGNAEKLTSLLNKKRQQWRNKKDQEFLQKFGGLVTVPLNAFSQYLGKLITQSMEVQKSSLKFNKTFTGAVDQAGSKINEIPVIWRQK